MAAYEWSMSPPRLMDVDEWADYEREILTGSARLNLAWFGPYHDYEGHDALLWAMSFGYQGA